MAEKEALKILSPNLTLAERTYLVQTTATPGWKVVVKIVNEACAEALEHLGKLDPESEDYERVCAERQRRARHFSEFSTRVMTAVYAHADSVRKSNRREEEEVVDRVASMFGIHPANPKDQGKPGDAISRTFGIHPARPKKVKSPAEGKQ